MRTITLAEAVDRFLEYRRGNRSEQTVMADEQILRDFLIAMGSSRGFSGKDSLAMVEEFARRIQKWIDHLLKTRKPATVSQYKIRAHAVFQWCIQHGYLSHNPAQFVRVPPIEKPVLPIFTHEQYLQCRAFSQGTYLHWMVTCAYRTGLSLVDVCLLRWEEVDMDNLVISRKRHKMRNLGGRPVIIPFLDGSDIHQSLLLLQEAPSDDSWPGPGYVHHELAGLYMGSHARLGETHKRMLQKLGIKGLSFKSWRNTFISGIANSGANPSIACKMSGHSNPTMLAHYIKPDVSALREAITRASDFMERKNEKQITLKSTAQT